MNFATIILSSFYFFIPAYLTNMTPPLAKKVRAFDFLDKEVDFGKKFMGEPILGNHKTWRGVFLGIILGMMAAGIQAWLYQFPVIREISLIQYREINILAFGFLMSSGAIFGDLFFAFIKRRLKLKPGAKFLPFDQTNYVIGAALFLTPLFKINILVWATLFILTFFLHMAANRLAYWLGLQENPW